MRKIWKAGNCPVKIKSKIILNFLINKFGKSVNLEWEKKNQHLSLYKYQDTIMSM